MNYDQILPLLVTLMIIWCFTLVVAINVGYSEKKDKNKVVSIWKGILIGVFFWIVFSFALPIYLLNYFSEYFLAISTWAKTGYYGSGALAGVIGNLAMIYYFTVSPTREIYEKKKELIQQRRAAKDAARDQNYCANRNKED